MWTHILGGFCVVLVGGFVMLFDCLRRYEFFEFVNTEISIDLEVAENERACARVLAAYKCLLVSVCVVLSLVVLKCCSCFLAVHVCSKESRKRNIRL